MVADYSWTAWRREVFGDPYLVWHEGPEFDGLLARARTAPAEVARMLTVGLEAGDDVAAFSFGVLAAEGMAPPGAEALLRGVLPVAKESFLVRVAQALHAVTDDVAWADVVVTVLESDAFWGVRIDAAFALGRFPPTPELIEALGRAVCDHEFLVRCHAANALRRFAGRTRYIEDVPTLFAKIASPSRGKATDADRARWQEAADRLTADAMRKLEQE